MMIGCMTVRARRLYRALVTELAGPWRVEGCRTRLADAIAEVSRCAIYAGMAKVEQGCLNHWMDRAREVPGGETAGIC